MNVRASLFSHTNATIWQASICNTDYGPFKCDNGGEKKFIRSCKYLANCY